MISNIVDSLVVIESSPNKVIRKFVLGTKVGREDIRLKLSTVSPEQFYIHSSTVGGQFWEVPEG